MSKPREEKHLTYWQWRWWKENQVQKALKKAKTVGSAFLTGWLEDLESERFNAVAEFNDLAGKSKVAAEADLTQFFQTRLADLAASSKRGLTPELHRAVGQIARPRKCTTGLIAHPNGRPSFSRVDEGEAILEHVGKSQGPHYQHGGPY